MSSGKVLIYLTGCPIPSALCHIEAKSFVNYKGVNLSLLSPVMNKIGGQTGLLNLCLFGFYGISTFEGYLMINPFLYK